MESVIGHTAWWFLTMMWGYLPTWILVFMLLACGLRAAREA